MAAAVWWGGSVALVIGAPFSGRGGFVWGGGCGSVLGVALDATHHLGGFAQGPSLGAEPAGQTTEQAEGQLVGHREGEPTGLVVEGRHGLGDAVAHAAHELALDAQAMAGLAPHEIGRAPGRARVCQYV